MITDNFTVASLLTHAPLTVWTLHFPSVTHALPHHLLLNTYSHSPVLLILMYVVVAFIGVALVIVGLFYFPCCNGSPLYLSMTKDLPITFLNLNMS